jgi:predicted permease
MWKGLAYSIRVLRRSRVVTIVAVLSLALGIGVNTAIFSLLNQVVLRSLPVRDPESLVVVHREYSPDGTSSSDNHESVFSYPMYRDLRDHDPAFAGVIARMGSMVRLASGGATESARAELISGNFFTVLGVGAAAGRVLAAEDDAAPGAHPVAVLSHRYWSAHFASSPAVVNQSVTLNGHPFVIVGVADARFNSLTQGESPDIFVPIAMQRAIIPAFDALDNRSIRWLNIFARLKPGEGLRQAQAATDVAYHSMIAAEAAQAGRFGSNRTRNEFLNHRTELRPAAQGISSLRDRWSKPLEVLSIMVGLVLLIACANVAGLLLARAAGRAQP